MPVSVEVTASGWFALAGSAEGKKELRAVARKVAKQALREWALLRGVPGVGLQARGRPDGYALLGLSRRHPTTVQRKLRVFGQDLPYRSADKTGTHMMDLLRREGSGWRVGLRNRTAEVEARLTLPGARILNRLEAQQAHFRRQFIDHANGRQSLDRAWVLGRFEELLLAEIDRLTTPKKRGRPRKQPVAPA